MIEKKYQQYKNPIPAKAGNQKKRLITHHLDTDFRRYGTCFR